jgi:hypothetical protein
MGQFLELEMFGFFQKEWTSILAILGIGTIYFLAPVLGYDVGRRGALLASLWAMIVKIGIGLFRTGFIVLQALDVSGLGFVPPNYRPPGRGGSAPTWNTPGAFSDLHQTIEIILILGETVVFMGAMILFVYGLQKLRRRPQPFPPA